jgi:hypothetical protein
MIGLATALERLAELSKPTPPTPSASKEGSVAELSAEEVAGKAAPILEAGRQRWLRREQEIERLYDALCQDQLRAFVRMKNGKLYQVSALEWREHPLWREMIISGEWRDVLGQQPDLDGCTVFISESAFNAWHGRLARPAESAASVAAADALVSPNATSADTATEHPKRRGPQRERMTPILKRFYPPDGEVPESVGTYIVLKQICDDLIDQCGGDAKKAEPLPSWQAVNRLLGRDKSRD